MTLRQKVEENWAEEVEEAAVLVEYHFHLQNCLSSLYPGYPHYYFHC